MERYFAPRKSNSKIANWSEKIWKNKFQGILVGVCFNFFIIYVYVTKQTLFSSLALLCLYYIIFQIILTTFGGKKEEKTKEEGNLINEEKIKEFNEGVKNFIQGCKQSLETNEELISTGIFVILILQLAKIFSDLFFLCFLGNLAIFHYPLNQLFPDCIFNCYLCVVQVIEGVVGLIECLIPRYEEGEKEKKQ